MRRIVIVMTLAAILVAGFASAAVADPACAGAVDSEDVNHGDHVKRDYVFGEDGSAAGGAVLPGGPGPSFHFTIGVAPGASFCTNGGAHSGAIYSNPGWSVNSH